MLNSRRIKYKLNYLLLVMVLILTTTAQAQNEEVADTVIVNFGTSSKMVFYINDKGDLESLQQYDLNAIANDLAVKLSATDSAAQHGEAGEQFLKDSTNNVIEEQQEPEGNETSEPEDDADEEDDRELVKRYGTRHAFDFDLGFNNYLEDGAFPDASDQPYSVRPWGSWYFGINSMYKSQIAGKLFLEYGVGISWYNFKFQENDIRLIKDDIQTSFVNDAAGIDYKKSKLSVTHLNINLVPVLDFGKSMRLRDAKWYNEGGQRRFRIGVGGYAGYRIGSRAVYVTKVEGDKKKDKDKDNFYLNNWRYGVRVQFGFRGTDFFVNYDLNELFVENKGPKLNAFSFGITF